MLQATCPDCGPVLIWESLITGIENSEDGIVIRYRCRCGTEGEIVTGRAAEQDAALDSRTVAHA